MKAPSPIPIVFNNLELWAIHELAKRRQDLKDAHGVKTKKRSTFFSDLDLHVIGRKSEYAVAKLLGVEMDLEDTTSGDGGIDLVYRGATVDVKCSSREYVMFYNNQPLKAELIIFTRPLISGSYCHRFNRFADRDPHTPHMWRNMVVVGWIAKERYLKIAERDVEKMFLHWHNLRDMNRLREYTIGRANRGRKEQVNALIESGMKKLWGT